MRAIWPVFRFHLLQIYRSKLVLLWILFSLFVQYSAVRLMHASTVHYEQAQMTLGMREIVIALIYVQFFLGSVLATVYGIWVAPYLHEESRAPLTYALPVNKAVFPAVYFISFLSLYVVQAVAMFASLTTQFGISIWTNPEFPWAHVGAGSLLSILALEGLVFGLALFSLVFGKVSAFLGGTALVMVLQVSALVFKAEWAQSGVWYRVYQFLPPLGETLVDLKETRFWEGQTGLHTLSWVVWLVLFATLFRLRLNRA